MEISTHLVNRGLYFRILQEKLEVANVKVGNTNAPTGVRLAALARGGRNDAEQSVRGPKNPLTWQALLLEPAGAEPM